MKYYTSTIPLTLAEKLKEKGMPVEYRFAIRCLFMSMDKMKPICPTYGKVFDWLINKGCHIYIYGYNDGFDVGYNAEIRYAHYPFGGEIKMDWEKTWHEAATKAIEKALTLI